MITAILDGSNRPTLKCVHKKYNKVMNHDFNFSKKVVNNLETLRYMAAKMVT